MSFHHVNSLWDEITVLPAELERQVPGVSDLVVVDSGKGGPCWPPKCLCRENSGLPAMDV